MSAWSRSRRTVRVAQAMLLAWCFAIAAGWANACLLRAQEPASHVHGAGHAPANGAALLADTHVEGGAAIAAHEDGPEGADDLCLSFCEQEQGTIPKLKAVSFDDFGVEPALLPWAPWPAPPGGHLSCGRSRAWPPPPGPPVAIRFLRLTL